MVESKDVSQLFDGIPLPLHYRKGKGVSFYRSFCSNSMSDAARLFSSGSSETVGGAGPEMFNGSPEEPESSKQASNFLASTLVPSPADPLQPREMEGRTSPKKRRKSQSIGGGRRMAARWGDRIRRDRCGRAVGRRRGGREGRSERVEENLPKTRGEEKDGGEVGGW